MARAKCNRDCFNCVYDDCIVDIASSAERKEIRERDNRHYNAIEAKYIIKQKPTRAKYRGRR